MPPLRILVVEDEVMPHQMQFSDVYRSLNLDVSSLKFVKTAEEALEALSWQPEVVFVDLMLSPGETSGSYSGYKLIKKLKQTPSLNAAIFTLSNFNEGEVVEKSLASGAQDHVSKPIQAADLLRLLQPLIEARATKSSGAQKLRLPPHELLAGKSKVMETLRERIGRIALVDSPVLILGPSGAGKELVAQEIHRIHIANRYAHLSEEERPKCHSFNAAALTPTLVESELFGHLKGAFSEAHKDRLGLFQIADGSTLFVDEVGELTGEIQAKLLRVLECGEFTPLGSSETKKVNVRVIAATNRDLTDAVGQEKFRLDLYFRLAVLKVVVPSLRDRLEDLPELVSRLREVVAAKHNVKAKGITDEAMQKLASHSFPGNVRELRNIIERAAVFSRDEVIKPEDIEFDDTVCVGESLELAQGLSPYHAFDHNVTQLFRNQQQTLLSRLGQHKRVYEQMQVAKAVYYKRLKEYRDTVVGDTSEGDDAASMIDASEE